MLLSLYTCLVWLSASGLWAIQAQDLDTIVRTRGPQQDLAPVNVDFAFSLFQHLMGLAPDTNIFISPVSISTALAMLSLGASGRTQTQLLQGLGFNLTETSEHEIHQNFQHLHRHLTESDTGLEMTTGSALFLNRSLQVLGSFPEAANRYYNSEALAADFQDPAGASRQISEYIRNKTQGEIADTVLDLAGPASLVLVNFIFFKGIWEHPFLPDNTRESDFHVNETTTVTVPMMFQSGNIGYLRDPVLPCQLVKLNYAGNGSVFFILPDMGEMDTVISALSRDTIQRWSTSLTKRLVDLYIPKVSLSSTYDLKGVLTAMGIADLFTDQAEFSGISQEAPLKVSKVVHKAVLQFNEMGMKPPASKEADLHLPEEAEPLIFLFDRPFLFMIFDNFTWSSLFLGKILNAT